MDNITVLKNTPNRVLQAFRAVYNSKFDGKDPQDRWSKSFSASALEHEDVYALKQLLPIPDIIGIEIYYANRMIDPHIDRGRKSAFQIPINVDAKNMFIYSVKNTSIPNLVAKKGEFGPRLISSSIDVVNDPDSWFYRWDDLSFERYYFEHPVLHNVALPHGGANFSKKIGAFFSVSYVMPYEEICSKFAAWV